MLVLIDRPWLEDNLSLALDLTLLVILRISEVEAITIVRM